MIIYGSSVSPFVRKTLVLAAEKGLEIDNRPIGLGSQDAEFRAASPFGKIPALTHDDFSLCDSSAIIHYMEAMQPEPAMVPHEARARGRAIWFDEYADTILVGAAGKMFFNRIVSPMFLKKPGDEAAALKAETEELPPIIDYLESVIPASGFLVEDRITLADIAVASPFVNLRHLNWRADPVRWPKTAAYVAAIHARASFAPIIAAELKMFARSA